MNLRPRLTATAVMSLFVIAPELALAEDKKPGLVKSVAQAQGKTDPLVTEAVEVSSILPEKLEAVPGSIAVVDEKELRERRPFSIKEAINDVPGVHIVGEDSYGLGLNIGIRGLNPRRSSRTLLMEDGMPLFLAPYADPSAHYSTPLERVERIEIVKGSGQTLYGPQTVGGMINFVTRPVPKQFAGSVSATIGNNDFRSGHVNLGTGGDWGGIMLDAINKKGDGIRRGHGFEVNELTLKSQFNLSERHTLHAKLGYYEENSRITETGLGAVEYAEDKFQAPTARQDQFNMERKSLQLRHVFDINTNAKLSTQFYYVHTDRASFRQINEPGSLDGRSEMDRCDGEVATVANSAACGGRWRPRQYQYYGFEPRLDLKHKAFGVDSDAVVGMRYHSEDSDRNQFRGPDPRFQSLHYAQSFRGVDGVHREDIRINTEALSYYAQNTFYLGNWSLTPGVRVEDVRKRTQLVRAEGEPQGLSSTTKETVWLPGLGASWSGITRTTVFAGIHRGYAPPRPDRDIGFNVGEQAQLSRTQAEKSTNIELGMRSKYYKGTTAEATLFNIDFDNIVVGTGDGSGRFINGGKAQHTGLELAGRVDLGTVFNTSHNFYTTASYTSLFTAKFRNSQAIADVDDGDVLPSNASFSSGNRLPYAPRHLASFNLGYQHPIGLDARIGMDYVSQQYADNSNTKAESLSGMTGKIPSYTLLNASVNYRPVGTKATLFVSGHNLADREYLVSRVDGMFVGRSRQVFAGIRYDF